MYISRNKYQRIADTDLENKSINPFARDGTNITPVISHDSFTDKSVFAPILLLIPFVMLTLFLLGSDNSIPTETAAVGPPSRPCSFTECQRSMCDHSIEPYECIAGIARNGCSANAWLKTADCSDSCDSTNCIDATPTGDDDELQTCAACTPQECTLFMTKCNPNEWFFCLEGSGRYGCSDEMFHWPSALSGVCTACCTAESCQKIQQPWF